MDPNEALRLMRDYIRRVRDSVQGEGTDPDVLRIEADQLAEYADALDGWLSRGGFLPAAWAPMIQPVEGPGARKVPEPLGPPNPAHADEIDHLIDDTVRDALDDARHYRLGEASGLDDPDLDPDDREHLVRYDELAELLKGDPWRSHGTDHDNTAAHPREENL